jgi:hypothetical protein
VDLTIVTYHYVHDAHQTRYPRLKARRFSEFQTQLDYIASNYTAVTAQQVVAALRGNAKLPPKAVWLTFDDGYLDHFVNVFPELRKRNMQGAFFPPARAVMARALLDVNKIHFILASQADPAPVLTRLREFIADHAGEDQLGYESYWRLHAKPSPYDGADVVFIKRMLQTVLPETLRVECLGSLFREFVSADPQSFGAELYVSTEQLREMIEGGMYVGSHGDKQFAAQ